MDPYKILEINKRATSVVIKAAYQALMKQAHPDHNGSEARAKELNAAYEILSNPDKKLDFDNQKLSGSIIGNYKVLESIAEGGFGQTYKAEHLITKDLVCIKHCSIISLEHDDILIKETKAIWDLRHYALPVMRDLIRLDDGSLALVMSYVPGFTLEQIIEKVKKLDAETVAWISERILNALMYLHHHGVIHGDIKPQNIIIQPNNHSVVLIDFGLAMVKPLKSEKAKGYTPIYASPEQIAGKVLLPASDYYSLGMVMIYALNGGKHMDTKLIPSSVPNPMCEFIYKITQKDVLSRPQENLFNDFLEVRKSSFGRTRSDMKIISGLT